MITKLRARILSVYGEGYQNHLADDLRINRARLSQYATGTRTIPMHHVTALCHALSCDPYDIIGYVELSSLSK